MPYPTNAYTTINTTINNAADFRIVKNYNNADGTINKTNPTQTFLDFCDPAQGGTPVAGYGVLTDLYVQLNALRVQLDVVNSNISGLERRYFANLKQMKLMRLTEYCRKMAFELRRLSNEVIAAYDTNSLPNRTDSIYPSSRGNF